MDNTAFVFLFVAICCISIWARGPVCYDCVQQTKPNSCTSVSVCAENEQCQNAGYLDIGPIQIVGRRSARASVGQRRSTCTKCCSTDLCNKDNCTAKLQFHVHNDVSTTRMTPISPTPVDGNWGSWTTWGPCTVQCGQGTRLRTRLCDSPPPNAYGKVCAGLDFEESICQMPVCTTSACVAPKIQSHVSLYLRPRGTSLQLECPVSGSPKPIVHWSAPQVVGGGYPRNIELQGPDNEYLIIRGLEGKNTGSYVCWAANRCGNVSSAMLVMVAS